jgi:hypothetical protein
MRLPMTSAQLDYTARPLSKATPTVERILSRLKNVHRCGNGWTARCPAHDDQKPSLSISVGKGGQVLIHCHRGCPPERIVQMLGLKLSDLFPPKPERAHAGAHERAQDRGCLSLRGRVGQASF